MRIGEATNQKDLIVALEQERSRRLAKRLGFETVWWNSIALVAGDHYATWNPTTGKFVDVDTNLLPEDEQYKARMVLNHAQAVARTELAKLTKSRPIMDIMANSDDTEDLAATKVGMKVLEGLEQKLNARQIRKQALWWLITCGNVATYVGYDYLDDKAGTRDFNIHPETDKVIPDDQLKEMKDKAAKGEGPEPKTESYPLGEIEYRYYTPFQMLPSDKVTEWDQVREIIVTDIWDIDVCKGMYGSDAKDLMPENVAPGVVEQRMLNRAGVVPSADAQGTDDGVAVHTWWCEPGYYRGNPYLRDGKMIRWAQSRIVLEESKNGFPYKDKRIPLAFYSHIPSNLSIWARSVLEDVREANLELDKTISQLIENKDFMANPMWLVATQHRIKNTIRNIAGSVVRYTHTPGIPEPTPVQGMQMPSQVENIAIALRDQILDISGQSEVSRGRMPSGVRSGVQVAYLQEEDDTKIAPTIETMELAIARESSMLLERAQQFYATERILGFYDRSNKFDVVKFKGVDLRNNTHVVPQAGSAMPRSKAARQQYTLELAALGIEKDPKRLRQMLDLGHGEPDDTDKAINQANRENDIMLYGMDQKMFTIHPGPEEEQDIAKVLATAVPVKKWHNHPIHIARHTSVMMDPVFDQLQISHPEIVRLFDEHLAMHEQMQAEAQQAQIQMLLAAKGAPDGPPTQGGQQPPDGGGGQGPQVMSQTDFADPIGGGATDISSRSFTPGAQ